MNGISQNRPEATGLIQKFVEGELDSLEAEHLLERLREKPDLIGLLYDQLLLDDRLHEVFEPRLFGKSGLEELIHRATEIRKTSDRSFDMDELVRLAAESPSLSRMLPEDDEILAKKTVPSRTYDARSRRNFLPPWVVFPSILMLFGLLIFYEWNPSEKPGDPDAEPSEPVSVAVVTNIDEVCWSGDTKPPRPGEPLLPGSLRFESGLVELLFFNGVRSVVEGPAELVFLGEKQVFCRKGNWSATVPSLGSGFEIQTPYWTIRDIGTEFYVSIDSENCDLHVLSGTVEMEKSVAGDAKPEKYVLTTNEAGGFRGGEFLTRTASDIGRFITQGEMRRRADAFLFGGKRFKVAPGNVDRSAICIVDADKNGTGWGDFKNAERHGGMPTEGRTPDTSAIRFARSDDRIRLKTSGDVSSLTVLLWMRIDRLNGELNPILMSEGTRRGGLVWHLSPQGACFIGVRNRASHGAETFQTPSVFSADRLGRWTHLALSVDGTSRRATVYIDGDAIFSKRFTRLSPLSLDGLDIGNWKPQQGQSDNLRQLDGAFDRAVLFDRVLGIEEIRTLYEQERNRPETRTPQ